MAQISQDIANSTLDRPCEVVVWTAQRRDPGMITLGDQRRLIVAGRVDDYCDEYADPWTYNDIIVTELKGDVSIFAYPRPIFPQMTSWITVSHGGGVLIIGLVDRMLHPERAHRFVMLRLDTDTFAIAPLAVPYPQGFLLNVYRGCEVRRGNKVVFPNVRMTNDDPALGIELDLDALTWGEPFPHETAPSTEDD